MVDGKPPQWSTKKQKRIHIYQKYVIFHTISILYIILKITLLGLYYYFYFTVMKTDSDGFNGLAKEIKANSL